MDIKLDTEEVRYINGTPELLAKYGFQKISDTSFAWFLNDDMESIFSLDTTTQIFTWYKGDPLVDQMISTLIQDMLDNEVIEHHFYEDEPEVVEDEYFDDTMVCAACGNEPDDDTNYCRTCGEFVEPVPRGSLD